MNELKAIIEDAFENRDSISPSSAPDEVRDAVAQAIDLLNTGKARVAEKIAGEWVVHQWLKKAVLLFFRLHNNDVIEGAESKFYDKVPLKYTNYTAEQFAADGARIVPPAAVRTGTMVDPWATVGSCAQIGKNVHLSGGVGIGGVLEPLQANPTIIEDNCFIGARSEIVEGVIVEEGSVISMGVYIGQSTRIYDRETGEIHYGRVPAGSVVVAGNLPSADGKYSLYAAIIVKKVDAKTRAKVGINALLRGVE